MIDFLNDLDISVDTINSLEKKYNKEILYTINCNEYEIKKIIIYLKNMNITCINNILIDYIELFFKTYNEFLSLFNKYDIEKLVLAINQNYHVLDELL